MYTSIHPNWLLILVPHFPYSELVAIAKQLSSIAQCLASSQVENLNPRFYVMPVPLQPMYCQYLNKMYLNCFGPSPKLCSKYCIKLVLLCCVNGHGKIWDHLKTISVPVFEPPAAAPSLGSLFVKHWDRFFSCPIYRRDNLNTI